LSTSKPQTNEVLGWIVTRSDFVGQCMVSMFHPDYFGIKWLAFMKLCKN